MNPDSAACFTSNTALINSINLFIILLVMANKKLPPTFEIDPKKNEFLSRSELQVGN